MDKAERLKSKEQLHKELLAEDFSRTTLSFYKYFSIDNPHEFRDALHAQLHTLGCKGRIYVAKEGINAQMNVPEHNWDVFNEYIQGIPSLSGVPYKIAVEADSKSFIKLIVRVKEKIVADGLDDASFDSSNTGEYLTAQEMNDYVDNPDALVIDMRNAYESEIGHFQGAITPDVDTFRDELQLVVEELQNEKDKPIALYCTGGIRCEKASAWMKHNGFSNVKHLKGGIIDYAHQVQEQNLENKFRGKNFVFDERMGEKVSDEVIATCHLCHTNKADDFYHCKNQACHVLFIGCDECMDTKKGYCSYKCMTTDRLPERIKKMLYKHNYTKKLPQFRKHRLTH